MSDTCNGIRFTSICMIFGAGAALGAGLATLYTPYSGKVTRHLVGKRVQDIKTATGHAIEEGRNLAHEAYDKGKEAANEISHAATGTA